MDVLLEAAAQVFDRDGLNATTNTIAARAGYSIGSLYQYFADKASIIETLAVRHVDEGAETVRGILADARVNRPPLEELIASLTEAIIGLHEHRPGLHAVIYRVASRSGVAAQRLEKLEREVIPEIAFHLTEAGRGMPAPERAASAIATGIDAYLHRVFLLGGDRAEFRRVVSGLVELHAPAESSAPETTARNRDSPGSSIGK
ncbi:TetR/AcrR family transcriptional regulator [Tsukamurella pulmonis]|uniref:TetR/AcrR family transcriptional regulator n=1 Tax=Tsukamurella pulmonis TaxID=47312 RepID=UPI0014029678|nr:TetR/AcrR family transcriptional regulator [Tsukamurella pulmonis]